MSETMLSVARPEGLKPMSDKTVEAWIHNYSVLKPLCYKNEAHIELHGMKESDVHVLFAACWRLMSTSAKSVFGDDEARKVLSDIMRDMQYVFGYESTRGSQIVYRMWEKWVTMGFKATLDIELCNPINAYMLAKID